MSRKLLLILLVVSLGSLVIYIAVTWDPALPGVEPKGADASLTVQYVSLATAVVSLLTAIVGLATSFKKSRRGET